MKKLLNVIMAISICYMALMVSASATGNDNTPVQIYGTAAAFEDTSLTLKNNDKNDPYHEVILHLGDAPVVDAATGLPLDLSDIKANDIIYAWITPGVTASLPPQANALAIVANIPAGTTVPEYYEIAKADISKEKAVVTTLDGKKLTISAKAELKPWMTKQVVTLNDLIPGTRIMVWKDKADAVNRVILFTYDYQGYISWDRKGQSSIDGKPISSPGKIVNDHILLPIRAVAEAAGYDVNCSNQLGVVVSLNGEKVFSIQPGKTTAQTPDGETSMSHACVVEKGVSYLAAEDLSSLLNLFFLL